jgi:CRISPR-associated endonuclease/helicase Cas3
LAIDEALERACQGQQVLWIENTVVEAQERYLDLAARAGELGISCGLLHSRFTVDDRQAIESHWVDLFGKAGWSRRAEQGRILVGTQVLEQSLNIDADFLVSRFAPTDMLLQRIGRLWRYANTPRAVSALCEAWVLSPDLESAIAAPIAGFGRTAHVYSPYVLCRSLEVWHGRSELSLPQHIRPLIEQTYAQRGEGGSMALWLHQLEEGTPRRKGRKALAQLARVTLAQDGNTLPESKAQTRYSESDSHELLLLRGLQRCSNDEVSRLTLLNGESVDLPWRRTRLSKAQWRHLAAKLMSQIVPVHVRDAPVAVPTDTLKKFGFQHCFYLGRDDWENDESLLRVALVDDAGSLHGIEGTRVHDRNELCYREDLGFRVTKN